MRDIVDMEEIRAEELIRKSDVPSAQPEKNGCILTIWGECSYRETGCSDCLIKNKITTALSAQPKLKGQWVNPTVMAMRWTCSVCKNTTISRNGEPPSHDFCPKCGADMRGEVE